MNVKEVKMSLVKLHKASVNRPEGWEDSIKQLGRIEGDYLILPTNVLPLIYTNTHWQNKIITPQNQSRPLPPQVEKDPSLKEKAKSLGLSVWKWANDGFKLVPESVEKEREAICLQCPFWDKAGNMGMGKCTKCGCTGIKWKLPSSHCPLNPPKWGPVKID